MRDAKPADVQLVLDMLWPCNCWFCRLLTKRILSRFVRRALVYEAGPHAPEAPLGGEVMASQEVDVVRELRELKATTSELKSALAEIKALLADLTGPYSYYRPKEEAERVQQLAVSATAAEGRAEGPEAGAQSQVQAQARAPRAVEGVAAKPSAPRELEALADILGEASRVVKEERSVLAGVSLKQAVSLLRTAYELLKLYPKSSVERMLELAEQLRVLSKDEVAILRTTLNIAEQSLKEDITPEENTMLMYMLLKGVGVKEESIEEEVVRTVLSTMSSIRRARKSGLAVEGDRASAGEEQS